MSNIVEENLRNMISIPREVKKCILWSISENIKEPLEVKNMLVAIKNSDESEDNIEEI